MPQKIIDYMIIDEESNFSEKKEAIYFIDKCLELYHLKMDEDEIFSDIEKELDKQ